MCEQLTSTAGARPLPRPLARTAAVIGLLGMLVGLLAVLPWSAAPAEAAPSVASRLVSRAPKRLVDTRVGTGAPQAKVRAGNTIPVPIAGEVPANATAVVLNATVVDPEADGFITAYSGAARPGTSNANVDQVGEIAANLVIVPLTTPGDARIYTHTTTHLVVDLLGWFVPAPGGTDGRFRPLTESAGVPLRILDTRNEGAPSSIAGGRALQVTGRAGVPDSGVAAVALNVTMTETIAPGWVQAIPTGGTTVAGASSNVNASYAGQTVANLVIVPVGDGGRVTLAGNALGHLIVDVVGWFTDTTAPEGSDGHFIAVDPYRVTDTRPTPAEARTTRIVNTAIAPGVDPAQIGSALVNLTVTEADAMGFVTGFRGAGTRPTTSNINADKPGATVANAAIIPTNGASFGLYTNIRTHLLADILGWFTRTAGADAGGEPGSVISSAAHALSGGQLIRYNSTGAAGNMTQQKTVLFTPTGSPPPGGWPIVAIAHGPIGLAPQCAISAIPRAEYLDPIQPWVDAGFAVVYPDLEAIGEPGTHPYMHGPGTGRSLLDAVRAARAVNPDISNRAFASGLSAGGHGALWFAEEAVTYAPDIDVRGVVALDPVATLSGYVQPDSFAVLVMQGMKAGTPSLDYSQILLPEAIARLDTLNSRCRDDSWQLFDDLPNQGLSTSDPMSVPSWAAAFRASDPGQRRTAPVLVVGATAVPGGPTPPPGDFTAIPHEMHNLYIDLACATGTSVAITIVNGGHLAVRDAGLVPGIAWAQARLTSGQTGCQRF